MMLINRNGDEVRIGDLVITDNSYQHGGLSIPKGTVMIVMGDAMSYAYDGVIVCWSLRFGITDFHVNNVNVVERSC